MLNVSSVVFRYLCCQYLNHCIDWEKLILISFICDPSTFHVLMQKTNQIKNETNISWIQINLSETNLRYLNEIFQFFPVFVILLLFIFIYNFVSTILWSDLSSRVFSFVNCFFRSVAHWTFFSSNTITNSVWWSQC